MQERSVVLKRDVRGRVSTPPQQRAAVVAEFERSGLPGTQFAKLVGVKYPTLMAWVERARRSRSCKGGPRKPVFVEAVPALVADQTVLIVDLGGVAVLKIADGRQVALAAQLIKALQRPC
jgi:transposase-like protein